MEPVGGDERDEVVTELVEIIKDDLDAVFDGITWVQNRPRVRTSRMAPGPGPADVRHYSFGVARGLDEDEWSRALAIVALRARRTGFTRLSLLADRERDHEVEFLADDGRSLVFGTAVSTILRATVGPPVPAGADEPEGPPRSPAVPPPAPRSDDPGDPGSDVIDRLPTW